MKIAVLKETAAGETRCAAIPETVKKFIALGAEVAVERGAGETASIADAEFEAAGAKVGSRAGVLKGAGIILTIDGRQPAYSVGVTLPELADLMIELGAHDALNLDGGGSTSFYLRRADGTIVTNQPSDGHWRPVANHLGIWVDPPPPPPAAAAK